MLVKLIKTARVTLTPGTVVDVSPEQANFLVATHGAEVVLTTATPKTVPVETRTAKRTTKSK